MASTLLTLALSLLIASQQPNVPESLKIQAVSVAQYSISYSIQSMAPVAGLPIIPLNIATSTYTESPTTTPFSFQFSTTTQPRLKGGTDSYGPGNGEFLNGYY